MAYHFTDILNSFSDSTDPNTGMATNLFSLFNIPIPTELDTSTWSIQNMMGFSEDSFFTQQQPPQINTNLSANMLINSSTSTVFPGDVKSVVPATTTGAADHLYHFGSKRKLLDTPESSSANSSPLASSNGVTIKNSAGKGKKQKQNGKKNEEKLKDVVHVRARRGQATDSHSLAERVRRGKINERLRCLQDIVPGCQKTVGMAAMLDEIINYVQSLQNQVEFLSMKLTAASNFHDFNTQETNTMNIMIQRAKACEAGMMMQKLLKERLELGDGGIAYPSTQQHAPFDFSFGCFPTLPNNK